MKFPPYGVLYHIRHTHISYHIHTSSKLVVLLIHGILHSCGILYSRDGTCVFTRISRSIVMFSGTPLSYGEEPGILIPIIFSRYGLFFSSAELPSHEILKRFQTKFFRMCLLPHVIPTEWTWKNSVASNIQH